MMLPFEWIVKIEILFVVNFGSLDRQPITLYCANGYILNSFLFGGD